VVTSFVSGSAQTFPLWVWSATRNGLPPQVDVLGTLIFAVGLLIAATDWPCSAAAVSASAQCPLAAAVPA